MTEKKILEGDKLFNGIKPDYPEKDIVVSYLRSGTLRMGAPGIFHDALTGDVIPNGGQIREDDYFIWDSELAYYVEKYNTRLPKDVEDHILNRVSQLAVA